MRVARTSLVLTALVTIAQLARGAESIKPLIGENVIFAESGGLIAVEAELFFKQTHADRRAWHLTAKSITPSVADDGDGPHVAGASGGAYLEVLPDTRRTHDDRLINGENFSNVPGRMAILYYKIHIQTPGRYYVWARAHSTGAEDNGLHVGLDDQWPESGRRMQWTAKNKWYWDSKQRTQQVHTGVPGQLYLDIDTPGEHVIMFSMREDGFEFDKWLMTLDRDFARPNEQGPAPRLKSGRLPTSFPKAAAIAQTEQADENSPQQAQRREQRRAARRAARGRQLESRSQDVPTQSQVLPRGNGGDGSVTVTGDSKQWHKLTVTLDGPFAHERDTEPNPFLDYRMTVKFTHESGQPEYEVPGYFAADGDAANSSAQAGNKWRAHLSPDKAGTWKYSVSFVRGKRAAVDSDAGAEPMQPFNGAEGSFNVAATDKTFPDFRARGRLQYVGKHYLQFAGSGEYFLKAGADSPETLLAFADFDDTIALKRNAPLKAWKAHERDWRKGDPTWKNGKGKGLVGALNYLASKGCNAFSFMPYNAGGDGDNLWPFISRDAKFHYDCSKLDQWGIIFDYATSLGLYLHFKMQENEIDDNRVGRSDGDGQVPTSLDGGQLGAERKLYCRELIARFAHELALNWNIGEENTQSTDEIRQMARYIHDTDPYDHHIVIHTFIPQQDKVYRPLLGDASLLTGASLQNAWSAAHQRTLHWVRESAQAGRPWVCANDEQGPANMGVPPDPGYQGFDGFANQNGKKYNLHDIRKHTLWGTLMAGGAGVEYYFGYQLPENDLQCEDFRSRDRSWDYCRLALKFVRENQVPFWKMQSADQLIGNAGSTNARYCFAEFNDIYLVYLPNGGTTSLDLSDATGEFRIRWFNPRAGGDLRQGSVTSVKGGGRVALGQPPDDPEEDWLMICRK